MTDNVPPTDPLVTFLQRNDLSSEQTLEALRLLESRGAEPAEVAIARIKTADERSMRSSWMSHPLTLAIATSLLTGGIFTAAFTFLSNRTTQIAETTRHELQLSNALESTALDQKFRAFESLIEIDPAALLIDEDDDLVLEKRREALEQERKQRICLSIAFGLIRVEPYMLPDLDADYTERDFAKQLAKFMDEEFDCLKDNGGFVPSSFTAPAPIAASPTAKTGQLSRIIMHWTAGTYDVTSLDRTHAHEVIAYDGTRIVGLLPPEANLPPILDRNYVAHTRAANSGSIGLTVAAMANARQEPFDAGPYPITIAQVEGLCDAVVDYSLRYDIPITRETVLTHAEVQQTLGVAQTFKWDITWLPDMEQPGDPIEVGDRLRNMASAALAAQPLSNNRPARCVFQGERGDDL